MAKVSQDILDKAARAFRRSDPGILYRSGGRPGASRLRQWEIDRMHIADCFGLNPDTTSGERKSFYAACEAASRNPEPFEE